MAKKTSNKNSLPENAVIKMLTVRGSKIDSADVSTWKAAINAFKSTGANVKLMDLLDNMMTDPVLSSAIERRINKITNAELVFQIDGKPVDIIDDLIDTPEFEEMLKEIALSRAYPGRTVIDVWFTPEFGVFPFPRKHVKVSNLNRPLSERKKYIAMKENDLSGYDYSTDEFILECGNDVDMGYIFKAVLYVIYKRGSFGDWAEYAEVFGMPFLAGKYNSSDTNARDQLFEALGMIGSKPVAAIPKEAELEVHDTGGNSTDLFDTLRKACNEEMLIAVLGQTMTTTSGSSRSQAEVHEDTEEGIAKSDRRYVQRILNKYFLPMLIKRGFPVDGGWFSFPDAGESISTKDRLDMAIALRKEGLPVDEDAFFEISGIPKGKQPAPQPPKGGADEPQATDPKKDNNKKVPPPAGGGKGANLADDERKWWMNLFDFFADAPTTRSGAVQTNFAQKWINSIKSTAINFADNITIGVNIDKLFDKAIADIYKQYGVTPPSGGWGAAVDKSLFDISNTSYQKGIDKSFKSMGAEFGRKNEAFINEFKHNAAVFAAFKNHRQTSEIIGQLTDENGNLRSFYNFKKAVLGTSIKSDYNQNWLKTEYNMAVRSARSAANFKKYQETADLYPNLEYLESSAATKRADHLEFVGTILPIDHPWWNAHMPPSDWGCECSVRNTRKPVTAVPEDSTPVPPVFDNNPGKTAEMLNMKEHPYIKGVCKNYGTCKFREGGVNLFDPPNRPECGICLIVRDLYKNIEARKVKYNAYSDEWKKEFFVQKNGGYLVVHKDRIGHSKISKNEKEKFKKELNMSANYAKSGYAIEMIPEKNRIPSCDVLFNNIKGDLKMTTSHNNIVRYSKEAVREKGAEVLLFEFGNETKSIYTELDKLYKKYKIRAYYYFSGKENKIFKNF